MANDTVMHPKRPSGTLATKIPIPKVMQSLHGYPTAYFAAKKKATPRTIAMIVIINTNLSNSILKGVFTFSPDSANDAI